MLSGDPYYHLAARALALVVSWFPLTSQAIALSLLVHLIWAFCGGVAAVIISREASRNVLGILGGLCLSLVPHASESGIGNVGNVCHWLDSGCIKFVKQFDVAQHLAKLRCEEIQLARGKFEPCEVRTARVSSTALARYRGNDYSVPTTYGFREVVVKGFVDEVVIFCGAD